MCDSGVQLDSNRSSSTDDARLGLRFVERLQKIVTYDHGMIASAGLSFVGLVLLGNLTYQYLKHGLQFQVISHPAILGLLLLILGFQTFGFTLLMEVAKRVIPRSPQ